MPKLTLNKVPQIQRHAASGRARVRLGGQDHYLGAWPEGQRQPPQDVKNAHASLVAEWLANGRRPLRGDTGPTVSELILAYWPFAENYYRHADGTPTGHLDNIRLSLRPLQRLFGKLAAAEFSPLKLKTVREAMIAAGLCRSVVNQRIGHIKRLFRWAVENELVAPSVYEGLRAVMNLKAGRSAAKESAPVEPAPAEDVDAVLPLLRPPVRAMVQLQLLTGMRSGEVMAMREADIDTSGPVWVYRPRRHKTAYRGKVREICLGPKCQELLRPFLGAGQDAFLFSPARDREQRLAACRAARKTPLYPSHVRHLAAKRKAKPRRAPRARYEHRTYRWAIARACRRASVAVWHPHQLRHLFATEVRKRFGLEAAQVGLGHGRADVTQVYAARDMSLAAKIAAEVG